MVKSTSYQENKIGVTSKNGYNKLLYQNSPPPPPPHWVLVVIVAILYRQHALISGALVHQFQHSHGPAQHSHGQFQQPQHSSHLTVVFVFSSSTDVGSSYYWSSDFGGRLHTWGQPCWAAAHLNSLRECDNLPILRNRLTRKTWAVELFYNTEAYSS